MAELTAEDIKETRKKYGLSQRSFAMLLGIGVASMVRYEGGSKPSKANMNLIRAAQDPHFMQGCLERDGASISAAQRKKAQEYVYAYINLEPGQEEPMNEMTMIYEFTLQQEVLNEQAANIIATIVRIQVEDELSGRKGNRYEDLASYVSKVKYEILWCENGDWHKLDRIAGFLDCAEKMLSSNELRDAA